MALYTVRSERQLCVQLDYNMLFRWFLDMDMVEPGFDHSTFTRNHERLLAHIRACSEALRDVELVVGNFADVVGGARRGDFAYFDPSPGPWSSAVRVSLRTSAPLRPPPTTGSTKPPDPSSTE